MSYSFPTEEYYRKYIDLQAKLRKSEEERLKLEMKFNEMVQQTREDGQNYVRKLHSEYRQFLQEDRRRRERNDNILRNLDRIEKRVAVITAKTENFKLLTNQYHDYLQRTYHSGSYPNFSDSTRNERVLDRYLQNLTLEKHRRMERLFPTAGYRTRSAHDDGYEAKIRRLPAARTDYAPESCRQEATSSSPYCPPQVVATAAPFCNTPLQAPLAQSRNPDDADSFLRPTLDYKHNTIVISDDSGSESDFPDVETKSVECQVNFNRGNQDKQTYYQSSPRKFEIQFKFNKRFGKTHQRSDYVKERLDETKEKLNQLLVKYKVNKHGYKETGSRDGFVDFERDVRIPERKMTLGQPYREHSAVDRISPSPPPLRDYGYKPLSVLLDSSANKPQRFQEETEIEEVDKAVQEPPATVKLSSEQENAKSVTFNDKVEIQNIEIISKIDDGDQEPNEKYVEDTQKQFNEMEYHEEENVGKQTLNEETEITAEHSENHESKSLEKTSVPQSVLDVKELAEGEEEKTKEEENKKENIDEENVETDNEETHIEDKPDENESTVDAIEEKQTNEDLEKPDKTYTKDQYPVQYDGNGQALAQYDDNGQLLQQYDENGQPLLQYDENNQLLQQYDENGQPIPYDMQYAQYDENGQPIQYQYDENGQPIPYAYDESGQYLPQYDESGEPIHYQYDENGQLVQYDDNGQPVYRYDENQQYYPDNQQYYNEMPQQQYDEQSETLQKDADDLDQEKDKTPSETEENVDNSNVKSAEQNIENVNLVECQEVSKTDNVKIVEEENLTNQSISISKEDNEPSQHVDLNAKEEQNKPTNVMEMLDTDTESLKPDTKASNDSDFDFSNNS